MRIAMKAIVQDRYGSPNVLQCKDIDKPVVSDGEVWYAFTPRRSISATGTS